MLRKSSDQFLFEKIQVTNDSKFRIFTWTELLSKSTCQFVSRQTSVLTDRGPQNPSAFMGKLMLRRVCHSQWCRADVCDMKFLSHL